MEKKYTIRDIAEMSGFSFKTVSRVINNEMSVKASTREKILKVIADTKYKPNLYAVSLNSKAINNVLISIRKTKGQNTTKWFDTLMACLIESAHTKKYTIMQEVIYDDHDLSNSMLETSGGFIDVLVLFYLQVNDKRIEMARNNNIPYIAFEKNDDVEISISNNNRKGMLEAAEFLFSRNLTRICLLLGAQTNVNIERAEAMIDAYSRHNLPSEHLEIVYNMNNLENIKRFTDHKIDQDQMPDVFFVSGDEKAIAVYNSVYSHGLSIPADVSIMGFDNISISEYYYPPLTTVGQNFEQLAKEMMNAIDLILQGEENIPSVEVEPQLIVRHSVK